MSKAEILAQLESLSPEERQEVRLRLAELEGEDWLDDGELTEDEKRLIERRLDEAERRPDTFLSWEEAKRKIQANLRK